jgi:hypothetical protein
MTEKYNIPSRNPANNGSLVGAINVAMEKRMQYTDNMLPARVIKYDRAANRVQVQPMIRLVSTSGDLISRGQIASVPVLQLAGGGFMLSFPLNPGDLGWIKSNDRDISLFLRGYTEQPPNTRRMHDFADSLFIPDVMTGYNIAGEDSGNAVLQNLDGSVKIALFEDKIKITAPDIEMVGDVAVTGNFVVNGINCGSDHTHGGVQTGSGNTGAPNA